MDNRIFNVNGSGEQMLKDALNLAFAQSGFKTAKGWKITKKHGLILFWTTIENKDYGFNVFPAPLTADQCIPVILSFLKGEDANKTELDHWDSDFDHDGHNSHGWRIFCEDWGHVDSQFAAICAVKPVMLWHGK